MARRLRSFFIGEVPFSRLPAHLLSRSGDGAVLPVERDPEFRPSQPPARVIEYDDDPRYYLRVVVNPFLSAFVFLVWWALIEWLGQVHWPVLLFPLMIALVMGGLVAPLLLLQYHCLDCGSAGRLSHWTSHWCAAVRDRRRARRRLKWRGPSPVVQIMLWFWVTLALVRTVWRW
jgi:hypothetical protein